MCRLRLKPDRAEARPRATKAAPTRDKSHNLARTTTHEEEATMYAVVVRVNIKDNSGAAETRLREEVVPRVSQAPGFVAGYWMRKETPAFR
jgi:hypothetical protein